MSACAALAEYCVYRPWQPNFKAVTVSPTDSTVKTSCTCTTKLETYTCAFTADQADDGGTRKRLADQATKEACAELVFQTESGANGVTYVTAGAEAGQCFATTGQTSTVGKVGETNCALTRIPPKYDELHIRDSTSHASCTKGDVSSPSGSSQWKIYSGKKFGDAGLWSISTNTAGLSQSECIAACESNHECLSAVFRSGTSCELKKISMADATAYGIDSVDNSYTVLDRVPCD